jgi:steroid 5-alpha reductase family enzyme
MRGRNPMNEEVFVVLNTVASMIVIICSVLSIQLLLGISRELKGLKTMDVMWKNFIIMTNLFILLGITRAVGSISTIIFEGLQPVFEALLSVTLILFFVFAIQLSLSIEEITE